MGKKGKGGRKESVKLPECCSGPVNSHVKSTGSGGIEGGKEGREEEKKGGREGGSHIQNKEEKGRKKSYVNVAVM